MMGTQEAVAWPIKDAQWNIETLDSPEHQSEAYKRLEYLRLMPKLALSCLFFDWLYLAFRVLQVTKAPRVAVSAYIFLSIELCFAAINGLQHLQTLSAWGKARLKLPLRLRGDRLPAVDVFLPCCGETLDVIMDTVRAACALDYPPESCRIVVLDDGCSKSVQESVERLSLEQGRKNLYYASRSAKVRSFSKTGNLNFGLSFVAGLPSGPSEIFAVLDIDMIPLPHWLRATLPYLMADSAVGVANPAQRFYNVPDQDPFGQSVDLVFDGVETIKDCVSSSWCTGTGFVARRQAFEQIQWFPTANASGFVVVSVYLRAAGWKIDYVPETVQWGLVPDTIKRHNKQLTRWTGRFIETIFAFGSDRAKGRATIQQRAGTTILCVIVVFANALLAFSTVAVPWILFSGSQIVAYQSPKQLRILIYLESLSFLATLLSGFTRSRSARSHGPILYDWLGSVGFSPFRAVTIIRTTLRELTGIQLQSFAPSFEVMPSKGSLLFTSLTQRVNLCLLAHLVILSAHLAGAYVGLRTTITNGKDESLIPCLFSQVGYPSFFLLWSKYILQSGIPIPMMLSSRPIWPLRENLLVRDPVSKVAYPSEEAISPQRTESAQHIAKVALYYHCVLLVLAWWI